MTRIDLWVCCVLWHKVVTLVKLRHRSKDTKFVICTSTSFTFRHNSVMFHRVNMVLLLVSQSSPERIQPPFLSHIWQSKQILNDNMDDKDGHIKNFSWIYTLRSFDLSHCGGNEVRNTPEITQITWDWTPQLNHITTLWFCSSVQEDFLSQMTRSWVL